MNTKTGREVVSWVMIITGVGCLILAFEKQKGLNKDRDNYRVRRNELESWYDEAIQDLSIG